MVLTTAPAGADGAHVGGGASTTPRTTAAPATTGASRGMTVAWLLLTAVVTLGASIFPVLHNHRFYFVDDSQAGAYGVWYRLGQELRAGHFPTLLNPQTWQAGNIAAEGQWGLWNPLVLAISWFVAGQSNVLTAVSVVKIVLLALGGTGVFALLRTYRAAPAWCAAGGVLVTLTGFTGYVDAPSWVTGLMTWSILPWFWAALRRTVLHGANPLPVLVAGYLEVTVGYLNGTLALIAVLLGVGIMLLLQRRWRALPSLFGVGVFCGLLALTIYLPGVLTQDVTTRSSSKITNDQLLNADLTDMATAAIATARPTVLGFWGPVVGSPLLYITWALPLAALVDGERARRAIRQVVDALVLGGVAAAFALGPAEMGPLRFQDRMLPFVATSAVILLILGLARARVVTPGVGRLLAALGLLLASFYLTWSSSPKPATSYVQAGGVAAVGVVLVWALARAGRRLGNPISAALVGVVIVTSLGLDVLQHDAAPASPLPDFGAPVLVSDYQHQLTGAQGDVMVLGDQVNSEDTPRGAEVWNESLLANLWFLNSHSVMGTYSPVGFKAYNTAVCTNWRGETCTDLFHRLFTRQHSTGLLLVDQLSVSTLQIFRDAAPGANIERPLPGWHILSQGTYTVTWVRDLPLPPAGGIVTTSGGTKVTTLGRDDRTVRLRVDAVGEDGGRLVFSRLAWPGYTVTGAGASLGPRVDRYLLSVNVPGSAAGKTVTVRFSPPGWDVEVACAVGAAGAGLLWSLAAAVLALPARRSRFHHAESGSA